MKKTVEVLPFDTTQVTSCKNWSHPRYGDPCHPLASGQHPPCVVIEVKHESSKHGQLATAQHGDGRNSESSGLYARCPSNTNRRERERESMADSIVRRLTPLECERLQGMPSTKMWDVSKMTHDEYIAWNLAVGNIIVQPETGKIFRTRGPGGVPYKEPRELKGYVARGYRVINICNGATKMLCRVNRVVWISQNGIIPPGYVVDHINNNKLDNRIQNLQLLTPEENSTKAHDDGLYKCGLDTKATKLDPALHEEIAYLYTYTDITQKKLAEIYGVSKSRISQIIQDIGWSKYGINEKGEVYELPDSARYRLQGNGIATPFWKYLLKRISAQYERDQTMGSLFDGQGSFPMLWEGINGSGTCLWSSEIDKHAVAVAKYHFPESE